MALPDTLKIVAGTTLVFSDTTYSPTDTSQPSTNDAQIDLNKDGTDTGLAVGNLWQSVALDLGSANLDVEYDATAYIEFFSAPTAGGTVQFYLGFSSTVTAGDDVPGGLSGTDAAYFGYGADDASAIEALPSLMYIGSLVATADVAVQSAHLGTFIAPKRWCNLVVYNNTSVAICATDAVETGIAITPLQYQVQD